MTKPTVRTFKRTLVPGAVARIDATGSFVAAIDATLPAFELSFDGSGYFDFFKGFRYSTPDEPFNAVFVRNNNAADITITLQIGNGEFVDFRNVEAGPLSIAGTLGVVGQPLTTDGGSITPVGALQYVADIDITGGGGNQFPELFSAAANVNGAIIRTAVMQVITQPPAASFRLLTGVSTIISIIAVQTFNLSRELYIKPGQSAFMQFPNLGRCVALITYDLL